MTDLQAVAKHERMLRAATDPAQTKAIEGFAAAGQAYSKEHKLYDEYVRFARLYVLARRRTTEIVLPHVKHGGHNAKQLDQDVMLLEDLGFTWKQWNRRCKELEISENDIEEYFQECFSNGWWPSINGLFRFRSDDAYTEKEDCTCPICGHTHKRIGE